MGQVVLGELIEKQKEQIELLTRDLLAADHRGALARLSALATEVLVDVPGIGPVARELIGRAFAAPANVILDRQIAAFRHEQERGALVAEVGELIELLLGQALAQIVHSHHDAKDEVLGALGGLREDLAGFRAAVQAELGESQVRVMVQEVADGAVGVRVRPNAQRRVLIDRQAVRGPGSVGIDLG